ncbi:hypothetical protein [Mycobacterium neglectum]|jgi:hypothetical protein|uniref:hypothetical protein n=1 Tax=Mycobacterium neglectum TaxID=242737 RepID=UPI000BFEB16B|nr:hypothetical protein [Mycobacterium neglectum]
MTAGTWSTWAVLAAVTTAFSLVTASPAASQDCGERTAAFAAAFDGLPKDLSVVPICSADIGPGFADPKPAAQFSTLTAGEITDTSLAPDVVVLDVLVATLEEGGGEAFVDGLFTRLGTDARGGTVIVDGRVVQYINVPGGPAGYAYGAGPTVVIGYVKAPPGPPSSNYGAMAARTAYTHVLAIATGTPLPDIPPPENGLDQWPLARGRFTTPTDPGWIYFRTPLEKDGVYSYFCGIAPGGTLAGCDFVPASAPEGTNQTIIDSTGARYVHSDTPTFTRDVDALPAGERLEIGPAACGSTYQGAVTCRIGDHKFGTNGYLE